MQDLKDSIVSPMLESARAITSAEHVKPQPTELVTEEELTAWEASYGTYLNRSAAKRLFATVRALQRDLAEARAKLVEAQQVAENHHPLMHAVIDNWTMCKQCGRPVDYALNGKLQDVCYEHREEKE
jgi:hypothetical protein